MESKNKAGWGIILIALGVLFLLNQFFPGIGGFVWGMVWAAGFVLFGFWFYTLYKKEPANWGLLIPMYVMFVIAGIILLANLLPARADEMIIPAFIMIAIAAPFIYVYSKDTKRNWWALIPGGITGLIGLGFTTAILWEILPAGLIVVGIYLLVKNYSGKKKADAPADQVVEKKPQIEFEPIVKDSELK